MVQWSGESQANSSFVFCRFTIRQQGEPWWLPAPREEAMGASEYVDI